MGMKILPEEYKWHSDKLIEILYRFKKHCAQDAKQVEIEILS